jgi:hypothetical protein
LRRCGCRRQHRDRNNNRGDNGRNRQSTDAHQSPSASDSCAATGDLARHARVESIIAKQQVHRIGIPQFRVSIGRRACDDPSS